MMSADDDAIRSAIATILRRGLVTMRGTASRNADYIRAEARHLHNLPRLLISLPLEDIRYYYEGERVRYLSTIRRLGTADTLADILLCNYDRQWAVIGEWLRQRSQPGTQDTVDTGIATEQD